MCLDQVRLATGRRARVAVRHGTTSLFAALDIPSGSVIAQADGQPTLQATQAGIL